MANKVLALLIVVAVAGVALGSLWLSAPGDVDASGHSATRSISPTMVDPGDTVTVTIIADNYGRVGRILDTPPGGTTQTFRLLQVGPQTRGYTFTAPSEAGSHSFSGTFSNEERESTEIGGDSMITVRSSATPEPEPTPMLDPQATRSLSPSSVSPGGQLTVTIVARDYGRVGRIVETLPTGLSSAGSQTVTLRLLEAGPQTVSYTVTASDTAEGSYSISGVLEDEAKEETPVGTSIVTVVVPGPQATRSLSPSSVSPGGQLTVTIVARDYGRVGRILETLPTGLSSEGSQTVTLRLLEPGPQTVSYTVTASDTAEGGYSISGVLEDEAKEETTVGGSSSVTVGVVAPEPEPQVNRAPAFSRSSTTRPIVENSASGANVGAVVRATDADGDRLTYSLTGTDAGSFTINSGTGQIIVGAGTTLDYETKASYMVTVTATDPAGDSDSIAVTITVTDVVEVGMVSGDATAEYAENGMGAVATYTADGPVTAGWSVSGVDMGDFDISNEGVLSFASAPDFENPTDADMDNTYMVTVKAEAGGEMAMQPVTVTVTNVDEEGTVTLSSMTPVVGVELTATLADPDMVTEDTVTWQWSKSMTMDGTFEDIDGATMMTYTPVAADENYYLMAKAMYTDGHGSDKMAMATSANAVSTGDPLVATYDTNPTNGMIDRPEVISAINDYLDNGVPSRADVIRLINLYLDS